MSYTPFFLLSLTQHSPAQLIYCFTKTFSILCQQTNLCSIPLLFYPSIVLLSYFSTLLLFYPSIVLSFHCSMLLWCYPSFYPLLYCYSIVQPFFCLIPLLSFHPVVISAYILLLFYLCIVLTLCCSTPLLFNCPTASLKQILF